MLRFLAYSSIFVVAAAPVAAASYTAKLANPVNQRLIARDITWQCGNDACQGATVESRPVVLCESLVKVAGKVEGFLVDGRAFSEAELATCNAAAKAPSSKALAAQ